MGNYESMILTRSSLSTKRAITESETLKMTLGAEQVCNHVHHTWVPVYRIITVCPKKGVPPIHVCPRVSVICDICISVVHFLMNRHQTE